MPATVVLGAQWGDEGKGRVVDWMTQQADVVARYAGGDNAGHTVIYGEQELSLHLVPSGILYPEKLCLMGGGMVVNPESLLAEIDELEEQGIDVSPRHLKLGETAHLIFACHRALDGAQEQGRGAQAIGTTRRGIGPTYTDKAARVGIRAGAMRDLDAFAEAVRALLHSKNRWLTQIYGQAPVDVEANVAAYCAYAERLAPYLDNVALRINQALEAGQQVLCEGAQGTLLDIDHGTYPYVTSSNPTVGGALTGLGFGPRYVQRVVGVTKAYTTRVGRGPFPTKLENAVGQRIRDVGHEYGTTTGRARDCGWLDAVALRYAVQINGFTHLALTKLDVLSGLEHLKVAVAYDYRGTRMAHFPPDASVLADCASQYERFPGWAEDIRAIRARRDLPQAAQDYLAWLEDFVGVPVMLIGVGPEREEAIIEAPDWRAW